MSGKNIQVAIKVRPMIKKENEAKLLSHWKIVDNSIQLIPSQTDPFYFDHIFNEDVSNQVIFDKVAKPIVDATLQGFNGTIFAYGQTSSGKTYTMLGDEINPGVMVLAAKEIFKEIGNESDRKFLLRVGYIEIYNEKIYDLLNKNNQDLKIHETPNGDVSVICEDPIITSEAEMMYYLQKGSKLRKCGETNMNERSSRSHALFRMIIESRKDDITNNDGCVQTSILNLVDLAGSERADQTGATGSRLNEGRHINRSLLYLSCVIKRLSENESDKYVNYRDSKLTRILQASLGGNALTAIICTIKPTSVEETNSTLSFAMRAKRIKNKPEVNETLSDAAMMKRLEKEIARLKCELEIEKNKNSKIYENQMRVLQLETKIEEQSLKIIHSNTIGSTRKSNTRRRTWCPSSSEISSENLKSLPNPLQITETNSVLSPHPTMLLTPLITLRDEFIHDGKHSDSFFDNQIWDSKTLSNSFVDTFHIYKTPKICKVEHLSSLSPSHGFKNRYFELLSEMEELRIFTSLEKKLEVEHDIIGSLSKRLEQSQNEIAELQKQESTLKLVIEDLNEKGLYSKERILYLESKISQDKKDFENIKFQLEEKNNHIQKLLETNQKLEFQCRDKISIEYEYEQFKIKSKNREGELIDSLNEKEYTISSLKKEFEKIRSTERICNKCNLDTDAIYKSEKNIHIFKLENKRIQKEYDELSSELMESIQENETLKNSYSIVQTKIKSLNLIINEIPEIKNELINYKEKVLKNNEILNKIIIFYENRHCNNMTELKNKNNENFQLSQTVLSLQNKNESEKLYVSFLLQEIQNYINLINEKNINPQNIPSEKYKTISLTEKNKNKIVTTQRKFQGNKPDDCSSYQYSQINFKQNYIFLSNCGEATQLFLNVPIKYVNNNIYDKWKEIVNKFKPNFQIICDGNEYLKLGATVWENNLIKYKHKQKIKKSVYSQNKITNNLKEIDINTLTKIFIDLKPEDIRNKNTLIKQGNKLSIDFISELFKIEQLNQECKVFYIMNYVKDKEFHYFNNLFASSTNFDRDLQREKQFICKHESNIFNAMKIHVLDSCNKNQLSVLSEKQNSLYDFNFNYDVIKDSYKINLALFMKNEDKLNYYIIHLKKKQALIEQAKKSFKLLQEEYSKTKILLNENEKKLENYKNLIEVLKNENNDLRQNMSCSVNEFEKIKLLLLKSESKQGEYEIENNNLKATLRQQIITLNKYSDEINLLKIEKNINNNKYINLKNEYNTKMNELLALEKFNSEYSKKILNNDIVIKQMETECHSLKESTSKLEEYIIRLEEESRLLRIDKITALENIKKIDCDQNEIESFKNIIHNLDKNKADLEDKLKKCISENETLNKLIQNINNCYEFEKNKTLALETKLTENSLEKQSLKDSLLQYETKCNILLKENYSMVQDKVKGQNLMIEIEASRQNTQKDRKCKRQSTHDEKRQSLWDSYRTVSTMTSPTDQFCSCVQLNEKISELKKKLLIKDSQIDTLRLELKTNPLKDEIKIFQKIVLEEENEKKKLLLQIANLKQIITDNSSTVSSQDNTNFIMKESKNLETVYAEQVKALKEDHRILKKKYQEAKALCHNRIEQIRDLEKQIYDLKCNSDGQAQNGEIFFKKFEDLRIICRLRNERIKELEEELSFLKQDDIEQA